MAKRRTIDLLPEIFRTDTNRKFLSATLDQLVQEPNLRRSQGFVGRRVGPGVNPSDNYVTEPTATRANYQLEPGVVFLENDTSRARDTITYPGIIDSLSLTGAQVNRADRLFTSEYYSWDPFVDLDKFTNYSQYYWMPQGPNSVDVASSAVPLTDDFEVTRSDNSYEFSGIAGDNPAITLVRGGNYTFKVNQPGAGFWIQTNPGVDGRIPSSPNISSRNVFGVIDNGQDGGVVTFNVPLKNAQYFYYNLDSIGTVDLIADDLKFTDINNVYVSEFISKHPTGIDGTVNLENRTVVFLNNINDPTDGGWQVTTQFDPLATGQNGLDGSFDSLPYDLTTDLTESQRYSVWRIQYVSDTSGNKYMQLVSVMPVPNLSKFRVLFGTVYSGTDWYKDAESRFQRIPLLTATSDILYYQDGLNPEIFGAIYLVDPGENQPIRIDDILGAINYTAPNGVKFTNGLKVQFRGAVVPEWYQNQEFYVEGVGTGLGIASRVGFVDGEPYFGESHTYQGRLMTGAVHSDTVYQQYIYPTLEESIINFGTGGPAGAEMTSAPVVAATYGSGIRLLPVQSFVTPEPYTKSASIPYDSLPYDSEPYAASINSPLVPDYITINRASLDSNAWSRSNRWFHVDVIRYSAELNGTEAVLNNDYRGKRPILEFRANMNLYNSGTQAKEPVDIIDFSNTDAMSTINGTTGYGVDGYEFIDGTRVIFAKDADPEVRNRIYEVKFINPDNQGFIIDLVPTTDAVLYNQTVVCLNGLTVQGKTYWFDGSNWVLAQQKTRVNQPPLFDVVDANGYSFGNQVVYPGSTFTGSRLFGYAESGSSVIIDPVLGFGLRYLNINNVGDIVFENYFYTDTFNYTFNNIGQTVDVSEGYAQQYVSRSSYSNLIGWQPAAAPTRSRQVFRFIAPESGALVLDVPIVSNSIYPAIQVFVEGVFVSPSEYTTEVVGQNTLITFNVQPTAGVTIEVQALSNQSSNVGFYQVPMNLENNPLNENSNEFTLGTIRNHYKSIGQNLKNISGPIIGANNSRDLGNILRYGSAIVQHSSPITLGGVFMRQKQFNISDAIRFNSQEYQKYKALLMDLVAKGDFVNLTPTQVLDSVLQEISLRRNPLMPFYWSDMIQSGETYTQIKQTYTVISTNVFDTTHVYDFTTSNFQGLLVYLNDNLLTMGYDYEVGDGVPTVTINKTLTVGDVITIREYSATYGSYVPNTPTKLGLYPAFKPEMYVDESYVNPTLVIRGHDGSITVAYGDVRDSVLLEFETRIFNNLKVDKDIPLTFADVIPGQFRTTDYSLAEVNQILSVDFLTWVGWNKLDYTKQTFINSNEFTWNYSQSQNKLDKSTLLGAWRGIYLYFYDTTAPDTRPWEMLGFSQQPSWWESTYGPAPYTSGNMVLWNDLEAGLVRDPMGSYVLPQYARPGLTQVIPTGEEGELLSPMQVMIGNYDATSFRRSWVFGDDGPTENAWRTSSAWPFAVARLLSLARPAEFFSLFVDRDRYRYNDSLQQWLWDDRYRLNAKEINPVYGNGVSKASYVNWVIDYNQQSGSDSASTLTTLLSNLDVRLCWRLGAYTDKKYLKVYTERSTPTSQNVSLLLPDESYALMLYQNQPFDTAVYSSVVVQAVENGWSVTGYSTTQPYFQILTSRPNGQTLLLNSGGYQVRVAREYSNNVASIPYGYVFTSRSAVCDFLLSYGALLERQGFVFTDRENGYILNWQQMANEFLYWSGQGWSEGSMINLNPAATQLTMTRPGTVAESIFPSRPDNVILNQNKSALQPADLVIDRLDNTFRITSVTDSTINYVNLRLTAYEHLVILDNTSIFADLIYQPVTGSRQSRVKISGTFTNDWNGTVDTPGFVLNQDNIQEWKSNRKYTKGEIVLFKNEYWVASTIINPAREFNYELWVKSDYDRVQRGLLPNAANASTQLAKSYDVSEANLENEVDLFSYGLIGFRPREYMQQLNLDDVSQVNLYQQFLGTKGTIQSAEMFNLADLGKESAEYNIYEYWAIQRGTYGATSNRNYVDLQLNEALLQSNPVLVQVVQPQETSVADQQILVENVWKSSYKLTSPDIYPELLEPVTDVALPTAGYVNLDDVDVTLFSLDDPTALAANLNDINVGTVIWVAKVNSHDWNVYRSQKVPGNIVSVADNFDGYSLVNFSTTHNLSVGSYLIIKFFNEAINGVYQVKAIPSINSVLISYTFAGPQTSITGQGVGFTLKSIRVDQPTDIADLSYAHDLRPGARVWVDSNRDGNWEVLEKTNPFTVNAPLTATMPKADAAFGSSVAQSALTRFALIGAPGSTADYPNGAVYVFAKNEFDYYEQEVAITSNVVDLSGYGNAVDIGNQTWGIAGASKSNNGQGYATIIYRDPLTSACVEYQVLVAPDGNSQAEFGHSVAMSSDERWAFVGAPGAKKVYAYNRVDVEVQSVKYTTDGQAYSYNWSDKISLTDYTLNQLAVTLDNQELILGNDYTVEVDNILLNEIPAAGKTLTISRRVSAKITIDLSASYDLTDTLATATTESSIVVTTTSNTLRPFIDYIVTQDVITGHAMLSFLTTQPTGSVIQVTSATYFEPVATITENVDRFGESVASTTNGRQLIVGCPSATVNGMTKAGQVFVYDRPVQRFWVAEAQTTFTAVFDLQSPTCKVNNSFVNSPYYNDEININKNFGFTVDGNSVTLVNAPSVGDCVEIETTDFSLLQTISGIAPYAYSQLGYAVDLCLNNCSLYIGAPTDGSVIPGAGRVEFWQNQSRVFGTITAKETPTITVGNSIRINNVIVTATGTTVDSLIADTQAAKIPNVVCQNYNGQLVISVENSAAALPADKLEVLPGIGNLFTALGLNVYVGNQVITSPVMQDYAQFGKTVVISDTSQTLLVGAPDATTILFDTFDKNTTTFDAKSTSFVEVAIADSSNPASTVSTVQSGAIYTFDLLPSSSPSVANPSKFIFGQQIVTPQLATGIQFGQAIDLTGGILLAGCPGYSVAQGIVSQLENVNLLPAWQVIRQQKPVVDISLFNTVSMYDRVTGATTQYFDFFDPLQGRLLGPVAQNIDYIGAFDPAAYNVGSSNNYGNRWAAEHVGEIWWDITQTRFIDPNQNDEVYASRRWGQLFPGSTVEIYQWIASDVAPAQYAGPGTPYSATSYSIVTSLTAQGMFVDTYYFWVKGISTVAKAAKKTLSTTVLAQYIESPRSSGLSYIAPINSSTVAIYNGLEYISAQDSILHVEFDYVANDTPIHVEYQLIPQNRADGFLTGSLYRKLQDSLCGTDTNGNLVPDPMLSASERYGVQMRPRQGMFVDRLAALTNYLIEANAIMAQYPISELRTSALLESAEPEPSSVALDPTGKLWWNKKLANVGELQYQNLAEVPVGYRYLIVSDSTNDGRWAIYQVESRSLDDLTLIRVQNYDTRLYWSKVDWYRSDYNPLTRVLFEVPNRSALDTLTVANGNVVKVTANAQGMWELYLREDDSWSRVGLQKGTIELSSELWDYQVGRTGFDVEVFDAQYFDQEPVIETRKVVQALNQEIFVGDLAIERNRLLILLFNYILSEQVAPQWLTKTSLIDVDHVIRNLEPFQVYRQDNQDFVLDYIKEVKPYHTQIRQFNLIYNGFDTFKGDLTDFDVPSYYDLHIKRFISPILDDNNSFNSYASEPSTDQTWQTWPFSQWFNNYLLGIESVTVVNGGHGYTVPPEVIVVGEAEVPAVMTAKINSAGRVVAVDIVESGSGYSTTATIQLVGGNGTGAIAVARMGNGLVRNIKTTIKYDRVEYASTVVNWQANADYVAGQLVRYADIVWTPASDVVNSEVFDPANWTQVPAEQLLAADRTMGYYTPTDNMPGIDLALLMSGVDYPGVQVTAPTYDQDSGYNVGNFDINPYDNIAYGPEGLPTYDPAILDAIYESAFTDTYLGTRPTDINVDGGQFVDEYESHAPEELVPGIVFDTLDLRVYTTPGEARDGKGHGFPICTVRKEFNSAEPTVSFADMLPYVTTVVVWNITAGTVLTQSIDWTIDWVAEEVTIIDGVNDGDVISLFTIGIGGGNELLNQTYIGAEIGNELTVQIPYSMISEVVVWVNGVLIDTYSYSAVNNSTTIVFDTTYTDADRINVSILGYASSGATHSCSVPEGQLWISDGSSTVTLTNSLEGTNVANIAVYRNGYRARPAEGARYISNGTEKTYLLPYRGGYSQSLVSDNDVTVYINNNQAVLGVDFVVNPYVVGEYRTITLAQSPAEGSLILISVRTMAQYFIKNNVLEFRASQGLMPQDGDVISILTWNDTSEQDMLTQVFVGPETTGVLVQSPFDAASEDFTPGSYDWYSYDYSEGEIVQVNKFNTGRIVADKARLLVSLNGQTLFENYGYTVKGSTVTILGDTIGNNDVVVITTFTPDVVPNATAFRIFQDMRGLQQAYAITFDTTTHLVRDLQALDDVIYVEDASKLTEPNLVNGVFGLITIDGERIAYRYRDLESNTVYGLRRGTAGTGAADHESGAYIYDIGASNIIDIGNMPDKDITLGVYPYLY